MFNARIGAFFQQYVLSLWFKNFFFFLIFMDVTLNQVNLDSGNRHEE